MENYVILELIGEGSYGKVFRGRRKFSGQVRHQIAASPQNYHSKLTTLASHQTPSSVNCVPAS